MLTTQRLAHLLPAILLLTTSVSATGCLQDNCYRALSNRPSAATSFCRHFTTSAQPIPTASPPPFTSQCAHNPARISSACTCLVPPPSATTGVCEPTAAMDVARNGGFDQVFIEAGGAIAEMVPWAFDRMQGARGDFIRQTASSSFFGYGAAAWHIDASADYPATQNGGYINAPLSICAGRTYSISFYASTSSANADPLNPGCFVSISTRLEGELGSVRVAGSSMREYGSWMYTPTVEPVSGGTGREGSVYRERGEDWEGRGWKGWGWNDTLSLYVRCETSAVPMEVWVDTVMIV